MYKKTIKYTDFNGAEREEDFYFNLTQAELAKMELGINGGYGAMIRRIMAAQDTPSLVDAFDDLIKNSYGEKSADGREFHKSREITSRFMSTEAYSQFFMDLCTDEKAASEFVNGILPSDLAKRVEAASSEK